MVYTEVSSSIEAESVLIMGKKILPKSLVRKIGNDIYFAIDVDGGGRGINLEELNPKKSRISNDSHLDLKDAVRGIKLFGLTEGPLHQDNIKVGGDARSGRHPNQELTTNCFTYLCIITNFRRQSIAIHPKDLLT